ncbi:hypothetical protein [Anaerovibrio sp.]|uniref:hypothetical protein n=1 Tax=Anaerovibrio sp. TaxID=1872532 RepID=UPI0025EF6DEB|nr:hypothetical protein [Anaerovibrio sp.]
MALIIGYDTVQSVYRRYDEVGGVVSHLYQGNFHHDMGRVFSDLIETLIERFFLKRGKI